MCLCLGLCLYVPVRVYWSVCARVFFLVSVEVLVCASHWPFIRLFPSLARSVSLCSMSVYVSLTISLSISLGFFLSFSLPMWRKRKTKERRERLFFPLYFSPSFFFPFSSSLIHSLCLVTTCKITKIPFFYISLSSYYYFPLSIRSLLLVF